MDRSTDFYKPDFWYALAIAVLVLTPLSLSWMRKWTWAAANVAFLGLLLSHTDLAHVLDLLARHAWNDAARTLLESDVIKVCVAVLIAYALLQAIQRRWLGALPLTIGVLAVMAGFVLHKLPALASDPRVGPFRSVLGAIGFSYVALRLVDVLRLTNEGRHSAPDLPSTVNYLLPFHMLGAGPIQGYAEFVVQPAVPPPLCASDALRAVERIALGLFKKYVVANALIKQGLLTDFRAPMPYMAFEALFYYLWVYLDFSAYSDITVGAGRLMGIATPENFNRPYFARNLIDFWDRWHISLSQFIYRTLFIPVQVALLRRSGPQAAWWCGAVAFSVSFLLCGLWHGLEVRWALWGLMHALGLVTVTWYRAWLQKRLDREARNRYLAHRGIRVATTILTQFFVAASLLVASWPGD
jgi:D-alanyl-lipoteichoic acid acyltransferase DltB (MBOAT superfamily)